jgi:hypothetical protein
MTDLTSEYFDSYFTGYFENDVSSTFIRSELTLKNTLYNAGIPDERFNVYMEVVANLVFASASALPTSKEAFVLVRDSIRVDDVLDFVWSATGTPFESTNEVVFHQAAEEPEDPLTKGPMETDSPVSSPPAEKPSGGMGGQMASGKDKAT